ncbi:MAG: isocitrate lyase/phosphoenolpyruvate mutase family protein, partial [Actinomycetota bacterium]
MATRFRALHEGQPFVIPNPWDAGSARVLAALGFKALASTSSGFAFTRGRLDGGVTLDEVVEHAAALAAATELPVSIDLENGYAADPDGVQRAIARRRRRNTFTRSPRSDRRSGGIRAPRGTARPRSSPRARSPRR